MLATVFASCFLLATAPLVSGQRAPYMFFPDAPTNTDSANTIDPNICGEVLAQVDPFSMPYWYASDVFYCLTSVPFHAEVALRFIEYYNTTLQFQSNTAYMKRPPTGYQQPSVDIFRGLAEIKTNVTAGFYKNQYAFEAALQYLIYQAHDGHLDLYAGILSSFTFASPYNIMSVSIDGKSAPQIYIADDVVNSRIQGWTPSPVVSINGENVVSYLTRFAQLNSVGMLEPHADWNQLMYSPTQDILGIFNTFGYDATFYPGDALNFTFANNSNPLNTFWLAFYRNQDDTGPLTTGGDFFNYFVLGLLPASYVPSNNTSSTDGSSDSSNSDTSSSGSANTGWNSVVSAYPANPDVVEDDLSVYGGGVLTGYFLNDSSIAVLSIPSFNEYGAAVGNFRTTVAEFIRRAKQAGLTKIVIDLQQNFGGDVLLALDTFNRFFPNLAPYAASRRRTHPLGDILGGAMSDFWDNLDPSVDGYDYYYRGLAADEWVITDRLYAATGRNFSSWQQYRGPVDANGDKFSRNERYNLSSQIFSEAAFEGYMAFDADGSHDSQTPPWSADNIVLLTDGLCASTCSLFVEMMTRQGGVKTVVVGGSPSGPAPMQAVSGSRGAAVYNADMLDAEFTFASAVNQTANRTLPQNRDPGMYTLYAGFTLRDQMPLGDTTGVPLQFRYEAAHCRIYYTFDNAFNMSRLWRDAARATWTDTSLCVQGSMGHATTGTQASSTPKPAPSATTSSQPLAFYVDNDELVRAAPASDASLAGIQDGQSLRTAQAFTQCKSGKQCSTTCAQISCRSTNSKIPVCLTTCSSPDGSACQAANGVGMCYAGKSIEQKSLKSKSGGSSSGAIKSTVGYCYPTYATPAMGCPAPKGQVGVLLPGGGGRQ